MLKYSILVNTCDKFQDCWDPFFKLWKTYWPDCNGTIYLNTEFKDYSYPGVNIIPVKGCIGKTYKGKYATWSQCLKWALDKMDTDLVLYLQEDYFLTGKVNNTMVEHYLEYMMDHPEIPCIQLTTAGIPEKNVYDSNEHLHYSDSTYFSYVSCQASIWRKEILLRILREHETAWNFEWWGSKRAHYWNLKFLTLNHQWIKDGHDYIPYIKTGVIGGKWYHPVMDLFKKHNIQVDFSKRGFYEKNKKRSLYDRIKTKKSIYRPKSVWEIFCLKLSLKK